MAATAPLLQMEGISKAFPGVRALDEASLTVGRGELHAVMGQNGAGKSTLIKILTGAYRRGAGTVTLDGQPVDFNSPQQAQAGGVSTIYQEVNLVGFRSVAENIFLGREPRRLGLIDRRRMHTRARELLERLGVRVDVARPLGELNVALQQMVAIARAISFEAKLVVMDEPTSSLDEAEVATLFEVIRQLKAAGVSVIFVSHRLDEVYAICDRVTIMRDGRTVDDRALTDVSRLELVPRMLGEELAEVRRSGATGFSDATHQAEERLLEARGLRGAARRLEHADLSVRAGEIVGLAGLLGSGRTELARASFGADPVEGGELKVDGRPVRFGSPADAIKAGIGLAPEDRKSEGIVPEMSLRENLTLALLPAISRWGIVDRRRQQAVVDRFIERLDIKTTGPEQKIRELSGGNQQKVLLARWLCLDPRLLLLDEPTRGIDVGAKGEIQALIKGSDRVVVLRDGRTVAELPHEAVTEDAIMEAMAEGQPTDDRQRGG